MRTTAFLCMAVNERQGHVADANKMVKSAESAKQK